jgi:hypothetical protein
MASNPQYEPPKTALLRSEASDGRMFRFRSLGLGALADLGVSLVGGVAIGVIALASGSTQAEIEAISAWNPLSLGVGLGASVVGGWVAGRNAGFAQVRHGVMAVLLCGLLVLPLELVDGESLPVGEHALLWSLSLTAGALGGRLSLR